MDPQLSEKKYLIVIMRLEPSQSRKSQKKDLTAIVLKAQVVEINITD